MKAERMLRIWTVLIVILLVDLGTAEAQVAPRQQPCAEIKLACEQAGFVQGGAKVGAGLFVDCIAPILRGTAQPGRTAKPLPPIDLQLVANCKARNPNFGQRNALPETVTEPGTQAGPIPPAASPQVAPGRQRDSRPSQSAGPPALTSPRLPTPQLQAAPPEPDNRGRLSEE
jgi:hypothetical protein